MRPSVLTSLATERSLNKFNKLYESVFFVLGLLVFPRRCLNLGSQVAESHLTSVASEKPGMMALHVRITSKAKFSRNSMRFGESAVGPMFGGLDGRAAASLS